MKVEYFAPAIPPSLVMSDEPKDKELVRIGTLANRLWTNFDFGGEHTPENFQMLAAIICGHTGGAYFNRPGYDRQSAAKLLEGAGDKAKKLYGFVASSPLSDTLKSHVCQEIIHYLQSTNQVSPVELKEFSVLFDLDNFFDDFWGE